MQIFFWAVWVSIFSSGFLGAIESQTPRKLPKKLQQLEPRILVDAALLVDKNSSPFLQLANLEMADWLKEALDEEFSRFDPFSAGDLEETLLSDPRFVCFRIRNRELWVEASPHWLAPERKKIQGLCRAIYSLMQEPDFAIESSDFLVYMKDGAEGLRSQVPIFCLARDRDSNFVLIPDYFSLSQEKSQVIEEVAQADERWPWEFKKEVGFWRGGANGLGFGRQDCWRSVPRASLVLFSWEHPDFVCAHFYKEGMKNGCDELKSLEMLAAPWMTLGESCQYKYLIDVDGWSCAYHRLQWVLRSGCVPLKQVSSNSQWYYCGLKPYVHYVPYQSDCSDLASQILWLRQNDLKAREIAREGSKFFEEHLTLEKCHLYLYYALKKYQALTTYEPIP